jgi:hypothetical protein
MQPKTSEKQMDYNFESKGDNTVSIYTADETGKKNEIVEMDVWSKEDVAAFRAIVSEKDSSQTSNRK